MLEKLSDEDVKELIAEGDNQGSGAMCVRGDQMESIGRELLTARENIYNIGVAYASALIREHELIRQLRLAGVRLEESATMHKCASKNMSLDVALKRWEYIKDFATDAAQAAEQAEAASKTFKTALEKK